MRCVYEFAIKATCPVDGEAIDFAVTVERNGMIGVEDLLAHARNLTAAPIMQEPFTAKLAVLIDAPVTTIGTHSGVKITCSC